MGEQTAFLWTTMLSLLWFIGLPLAVNLFRIRAKEINFVYLVFLLLGIYFVTLYFHGKGWTIYAWLGTTLLFYFIDRRFSLRYDFLSYGWKKEESYKKKRKKSRWSSWRDKRKQEKEEKERWEEFKQKNCSDFNNDEKRDYEEKRERTYPKDESHNFSQKKASDEVQDWPDIDTMSQDEIKKEWSIWQQQSTWTEKETDRMKLLKNAMTKKKRSGFN